MKLWITFLLALLAAAPAGADGWTQTANTMSDPRWAPAYTLLAGGTRGLIVGGYSFPTGRCVATADEFDPQTRRFVPCAGQMAVPRNFAQATLLPDGRVLIAGGYNTILGTLKSAELYDPKTRTFTRLPSRMTAPREMYTATTLTDGRVLLVAGFDTHRGRTLPTAEVYDPHTQAFTPTGSLATDRFGQDAVRLPDGRVLVAGGQHWFVGKPGVPLASAEIYDPATGRWHETRSPLHFARDRPTLSLLPGGKVLVAGGQNGTTEPGAAEVFDPATETFTVLPGALGTPRMAHSAAVLPDGQVLLVGGWSIAEAATTRRTEMFDPNTQTFLPAPLLPAGAHDEALLVFWGGLVLAAGGKQAGSGKETSLASGWTWQANP